MVALLAAVAVAGGVVHADGRVGQFRIDVTTDAQVRRALGPPSRVYPAIWEPTGKRIGTRLVYGRTTYSFRGRRLADFDTQSPAFRTERGSRVGMQASLAAMREGRKIVPGCSGPLIHLRWDRHHELVLGVLRGRVSSIVYVGPRTTKYEPFC
jgi:hypothetical protein